jgi:hypothetical protein
MDIIVFDWQARSNGQANKIVLALPQDINNPSQHLHQLKIMAMSITIEDSPMINVRIRSGKLHVALYRAK